MEDDNDDPVIESEVGTLTDAVNEGETVIYTATATDEDTDDTVTLSLSGTDADKMTIDPSTGVVTLDNAADYENQQQSYAFDLTVDDGTTATNRRHCC